MELNGKYNFIDQRERLIYIGMAGNWHQFVKCDEPHVVWAELLDSDLHMIEETNDE